MNLWLFVALAAIWGASFLFLRVAAPAFGAGLAAELRVGIAFLALALLAWVWPAIRHRGGQLPAHVARWHFWVVGALNSAVPFALYGLAALSLPAGYLAILNALVPLWGGLLAAVFLGEALRLRLVLGVVFAALGVSLLVQLGPVAVNAQTLLAAAACAGATFCYAVAGMLTKRWLSEVNAFESALRSLGPASVLLLPIALVEAPHAQPTAMAWWSVAALGLLCSAVAYLLFFRLIRAVGPIKATSVTFLIPGFGVFWGFVFLGEPLTLGMGLGLLLVIAASALVLSTPSAPASPQAHHRPPPPAPGDPGK